jgi:hypothetical protein
MRSLCLWLAVLAFDAGAQPGAGANDPYGVMLRSASLAAQRTALAAILLAPPDYVPRIRQSLRDYPKQLQSDYQGATRAVYVAALVRDPSFAPILADMLGDEAVIDECIYACPVEFALTVFACFAGWTPPRLDPKLDTVKALQQEIAYVAKMKLEVRRIDELVSGPGFERRRKEVEGKSEEELIRLAGPGAGRGAPREFAAIALQASVVTSRNRLELYLLAINEGRPGASHEYRSSVYQAIYRAETARARGR